MFHYTQRIQSISRRSVVAARVLPCLLVVVLISGCQSFPDMGSIDMWKWKKKKEETLVESEHPQASRVASIWTDDVLHTPGKPTVRGFGGRIYFYNDVNKTTPVEGQLVVYAFDDTSSQQTNRKADRKYVFTPEQLRKHYSESKLGSSYSVWLPWDEVGGEMKTVTLLPVFTSSVGKIVMGHQTLNVLPGSRDEADAENGGSPSGILGPQDGMLRATKSQSDDRPVIQRTSHETIDLRDWRRLTNQRKRKMQTTTIRVPQETSQRIRRATHVESTVRMDDAADRLEQFTRVVDAASTLEARRSALRQQLEGGSTIESPSLNQQFGTSAKGFPKERLHELRRRLRQLDGQRRPWNNDDEPVFLPTTGEGSKADAEK